MRGFGRAAQGRARRPSIGTASTAVARCAPGRSCLRSDPRPHARRGARIAAQNFGTELEIPVARPANPARRGVSTWREVVRFHRDHRRLVHFSKRDARSRRPASEPKTDGGLLPTPTWGGGEAHARKRSSVLLEAKATVVERPAERVAACGHTAESDSRSRAASRPVQPPSQRAFRVISLR